MDTYQDHPQFLPMRKKSKGAQRSSVRSARSQVDWFTLPVVLGTETLCIEFDTGPAYPRWSSVKMPDLRPSESPEIKRVAFDEEKLREAGHYVGRLISKARSRRDRRAAKNLSERLLELRTLVRAHRHITTSASRDVAAAKALLTLGCLTLPPWQREAGDRRSENALFAKCLNDPEACLRHLSVYFQPGVIHKAVEHLVQDGPPRLQRSIRIFQNNRYPSLPLWLVIRLRHGKTENGHRAALQMLEGRYAQILAYWAGSCEYCRLSRALETPRKNTPCLSSILNALGEDSEWQRNRPPEEPVARWMAAVLWTLPPKALPPIMNRYAHLGIPPLQSKRKLRANPSARTAYIQKWQLTLLQLECWWAFALPENAFLDVLKTTQSHASHQGLWDAANACLPTLQLELHRLWMAFSLRKLNVSSEITEIVKRHRLVEKSFWIDIHPKAMRSAQTFTQTAKTIDAVLEVFGKPKGFSGRLSVEAIVEAMTPDLAEEIIQTCHSVKERKLSRSAGKAFIYWLADVLRGARQPNRFWLGWRPHFQAVKASFSDVTESLRKSRRYFLEAVSSQVGASRIADAAPLATDVVHRIKNLENADYSLGERVGELLDAWLKVDRSPDENQLLTDALIRSADPISDTYTNDALDDFDRGFRSCLRLFLEDFVDFLRVCPGRAVRLARHAASLDNLKCHSLMNNLKQQVCVESDSLGRFQFEIPLKRVLESDATLSDAAAHMLALAERLGEPPRWPSRLKPYLTGGKRRAEIAFLENKAIAGELSLDQHSRLKNLKSFEPKPLTSRQREQVTNRLTQIVVEMNAQLHESVLASFVAASVQTVCDGASTVTDPNVRNAARIYTSIRDNKRTLKRMLKAWSSGDQEWVDRHPANRCWLAKARDAGVNTAAWLRGHRRVVGSDVLYVASDPFEVMQMGNYFRTCLSAGGMNAHSTVANAADVNKQVIYAMNVHCEVIGRRLVALDENFQFVCFHTYLQTDRKKLLTAFDDFCRQWAELCRTPIWSGEYSVESLVAPDWWDDGAEPLGELSST